MLINIPKLSLVVLIGPSGSGKTTLARRHYHECVFGVLTLESEPVDPRL
jgi:predicted kinase